MDIKPYHRDYSEVIRLLYQRGVLASYPRQIKRDDLQYADGIDIIIPLIGMTPAKFKEYNSALLWAAYEEAKRYNEEPIKFARFDVQLNRTEKGRKMITKPVREYTARGHPDPEVMVFGEEALGYELPEKVAKPFLVNRVEEILAITETYMKEYVLKQRPYKVIALVISIRRKYQ